MNDIEKNEENEQEVVTVEQDEGREEVKPPRELSVQERLDRLERLIVRSLLGMPLDRGGARLIDIGSMPRPTANALNKRYTSWGGVSSAEDNAEAEYALRSILDICAADIAAAQSEQAAAKAEAERLIRDAKRAEAEEAKRAANEAARIAQEEIDALADTTA